MATEQPGRRLVLGVSTLICPSDVCPATEGALHACWSDDTEDRIRGADAGATTKVMASPDGRVCAGVRVGALDP